MLAQLLYEKLQNPQSARDDLMVTLPDLFGQDAATTFTAMVIKNPSAIFYPNSSYGTLQTALSYYVQPVHPPFDEVSIQAATFADNSGWITHVGAHFHEETLGLDNNHTIGLSFTGRNNKPESSILRFNWTYHTRGMEIDLEKRTIDFSVMNDRERRLVIPLDKLTQAGTRDEISKAQSHQEIEIAGIELGPGDNPILGFTLLERNTQRHLLDLVVPAVIRVDPTRLTQHITPPKYIDRLA